MQFEFSDAEVAACHVDDGVLTVRFAAARVQESSRAEAQWMPLTLVAEGVAPHAGVDAVALQGRLHDGLLVTTADGRRQRSLSVPFDNVQAATLELEFAHGLRLHVSVQRVQVLPPACPQAVGAYQC